MTRSELQTTLKGQTRTIAIASALWWAAISAAVIASVAAVIYAQLRQVHADGFEWSVPASLVATVAATGFLAYQSRRLKCSAGRVLKARWNEHYSGTRWRTPAGEVAEFVDSDPLGKELALRFDNGDVQRWSVGDLVSMDGRDTKSDDLVKWISSPITNVVAVAVYIVASVGLAMFCSSATFLVSSIALSAAFGINVGIISYACYRTDNYVDDRNALLHRVSVCDWKALDGRVGKVRWACRQSGDTKYHTDYLTLVFPDGSKKRFERPDLVPMGHTAVA